MSTHILPLCYKHTLCFAPPPSHASINISFECLLTRLKLEINVGFASSHAGIQLPYSPDTLAVDNLSTSYILNFLGMDSLKFLKCENIIVILFQGVFLLWLVGLAQ